jgi:hypothetical protein
MIDLGQAARAKVGSRSFLPVVCAVLHGIGAASLSSGDALANSWQLP